MEAKLGMSRVELASMLAGEECNRLDLEATGAYPSEPSDAPLPGVGCCGSKCRETDTITCVWSLRSPTTGGEPMGSYPKGGLHETMV